jgi:hypothetical protein
MPDVTNHPIRTTTKYGFGANLEQSLNGGLTAFERFGWNEGRRESFAYTEVNQAVTFGIGANGKNGVADWIALVLHFLCTRYLGTTALNWRWAERDFCWAMAI